MDNQPLVTIGIFVYNEDKYILETIESAINQSYRNIEIIISDNASTDTTYQIMQEYAKKDSRISIYRQNKNVGPKENASYPLKHSNAEYFMFLGGHDVIAEDFIEKAIKILLANHQIISVCPKTITLEEGIVSPEDVGDKLNTLNLSLKDRVLEVCRKVNYGNNVYGLYRRKILQDSLVDIDGGDLLIMLLASLEGDFVYLEDSSYFFRTVRKPEKRKEQLDRYLEYGFSENWEFKRIALPFYYVFKNKNFKSAKEKLGTMMVMQQILRASYEFRWGDIIKYFFQKRQLKLSICLTIIAIISVFRRIYKKV
jgi:glycosyltransferase involved in cell wall biosynthesis